MTPKKIFEVWEQLEAPIRSLDRLLETYAQDHGMSLDRNRHDWPERGLEWGTGTRRLIQIYLENEDEGTFNVWICASEDRGQERYWKQEFLKHAVPMTEISEDLLNLLEKSRKRVESWNSNDLEFASKLTPLSK